MMGATTFWGLPVFVTPMIDDTGWSRTPIFGALTVRFIVGALGGLLLGGLADRRGGPARLLLIGVLIDSGSMIALRWVQDPLQFILVYGVIGGAGNTGMRLMMVTLIPKWFIQRRGAAVGYSSMGGGAAALVMVPLIALLVDQLGWRDAWVALSLLMLVTIIPCVPFAVRAPEDMGLQPDGNLPVTASSSRPLRSDTSFSLSEAMHSWVFWVLLVSIVFGSYSLQTGTIIMVPYFKDIGFSPGIAASAVSVYGFFSIAARFIWGFAADRLSVRRALIVQAALTSVGGFPTLSQLILPEFFGRAHIGSIVGVTQFFSTVIGSAGPLIAGFIFDQTGSYSPALWLLVGTWLGCSLAVFAARQRLRADQPLTTA